MTDQKIIPFCQPDMGWEEERDVMNVLRSGWLGYGSVAKQFEEVFSKHLGGEKSSYCVAVSSCSMGLILALKTAGIGWGDEVITSPLTFAATVNAILAVGATPVFVDVDEQGSLDPMKVGRAITKFTKSVIPVHLWGSPCDMWGMLNVANAHNLVVIEDAAQAFGGSYFDKPLGTFGRFGVFSFYPTKNITCGDGGMVVCQNEADAEKVLMYASQGLSAEAWKRYGSGEIKSYEVVEPGYKGLMTDISAALGLAQLERWPELRRKRAALWEVYAKAFGQKPIGHSKHIYEIRIKNRDSFRRQALDMGFMTGIHYKSLSQEPAYKHFAKGKYPEAEKIGSETVSLPLGTKMSLQDAITIVQAVKQIKGEME